MAYMPSGGPMPPIPMGGPMGGPPVGPMPPAGGAPPPWLMAQLMQEQQAPPRGMEGLVTGLQQLLDQWTERDPNTVAGSYYNDLANLLSSFMG